MFLLRWYVALLRTWRRRCFHGINAMILCRQISDVIANGNARYKRNELECVFHDFQCVITLLRALSVALYSGSPDLRKGKGVQNVGYKEFHRHIDLGVSCIIYMNMHVFYKLAEIKCQVRAYVCVKAWPYSTCSSSNFRTIMQHADRYWTNERVF